MSVVLPAPGADIMELLRISPKNFSFSDGVNNSYPQLKQLLLDIIEQRKLTALFQPIINMQDGSYIGYEGLIRGPSDSPLHAPVNLFRAAALFDQTSTIERLCREVVLESFARLNLPGKLFLNVSPECLTNPHFREGNTLAFMKRLGISPERVIIELTEHQPTYDYSLLRNAVVHYREQGFQIAIDDLGEGFSSLRLWSELMPDYVKMDMHFSQGLHQDKVKQHFVRTIQHLSEMGNCKVIAEGIETAPDMGVLLDIGIAYGQGYLIARPTAIPGIAPAPEIPALIRNRNEAGGQIQRKRSQTVKAETLLIRAPAVSPETTNDEVYAMISRLPELHAIPVVDKSGTPVGLISRYKLIDFFSKMYSRELYGKRPCTRIMDENPVVIDKNMTIQSLSKILVNGAQHHLSDGFIITENNHYIGIGTGQDLMRAITELQIHSARYANPLTMLPGNVAINEEIDRLLEQNNNFVAAYCDLDHFKPYNDRFGYNEGDKIIEYTGRILNGFCDPQNDFIGHIGGDDFFILFQSGDWQKRCEKIIQEFQKGLRDFIPAEDISQGGYLAENRQGEKVFVPLVSLSIGAVQIPPGKFSSHAEISTLASTAKKMAKKMIKNGAGKGLFVDRRQIVPAENE